MPSLQRTDKEKRNAPGPGPGSRSTIYKSSENESVLWNGWINLVGPREDATLQVENFAEPGFAQEVHGLGGALPAAAMRHNFSRRIQLVDASCQLAKGDQVAL